MIIGFGVRSYTMLFPFIMPIFWFMRTYLSSRFASMEGKSNLQYHPIFFSFITIFGDLFAGSLNILTYFIQRRRGKDTERESNKSQVSEKESQLDLHMHSTVPLFKKTLLLSPIRNIKLSLQMYLVLSVVSLFEVTVISAMLIIGFYANSDVGFQMNILLIIFEGILSTVILKYNIYRHQLFSIALIIIGIVLIFFESVSLGFGPNANDNYSYVYYLCFLPIYFILGFLDVTQKYLMEKKYYTPYKLALLQGTFSFFYFCFIFLFLSDFECKWAFCSDQSSTGTVMIEPIISTFKLFFRNNGFTTFLTLIAYELICGGYIICLFLTIYFYTPTHRSVSDSLTSFISWIMVTVETKQLSYYKLIGYILVVFSCLIYNEFFILYCFGLDVNTRKEIENRSSLELQLVESNDAFDFSSSFLK